MWKILSEHPFFTRIILSHVSHRPQLEKKKQYGSDRLGSRDHQGFPQRDQNQQQKQQGPERKYPDRSQARSQKRIINNSTSNSRLIELSFNLTEG